MARTAQVMPTQMAAAPLAAWDDDRLRALLESRPDLADPPPRWLAELAERASAPASAQAAYRRLDRSAQQVVEMLVLLPPPVTVAGLAAVLAPGVSPADLERPLALLERLALVFRDGGAVTLNPGLKRLPHRAGLGPPVAAALGAQAAPQLAEVCRRLGVRHGANKTATLRTIAECVGHPGRVRQLLREAPAGTAALAEKAALGAEVTVRGGIYGLDDRTPAGWLARRGFLAPVEWFRFVMPGEVGLAMRGGHVFEDFWPDAPEVATVPVDAATVDAAGAEAALGVVADVASVLQALAAQPAKLLKDGGVGVRDVRRAAKAVGRTERDTARLLDLAVAAGLVWIDPSMDDALPTGAFDQWLGLEAAPRWARLVSGWTAAGFHPSLAGATSTKDKPIPPLLPRAYEDGASDRRRLVLEAMAGLPAGMAAEATALGARACWASPELWSTGPAPPAMLARWAIEECELLGLWARGSLTDAGRQVAAGDMAAAEGALAALVPAPVAELVLQADLTAVAPGAVAPYVAAELELLAEVESTGAATVYRFSEQSLRPAFDVGRTAEEIRAFLDRHAVRGVPQALAYLITDIGRRHGQARVGAARCYLRSDDVALLSELAQARAASRLGLRRLAPTVVVTDAEPAAVLTTLRAAGYLPAEEDATGAVVVARPATRRAPARSGGTPRWPDDEIAAMAGADVLLRGPRSGPEVDLSAVVAGLRQAPPPKASKAPAPAPAPAPPRPAPSPLLFTEGTDRPPHIAKAPAAIRQLLEQACDEDWLVRVAYTNGKGRTSQLNLVVDDVSPSKLIVEVLPNFNIRTLNLDRVEWARALTEAEEDQFL